jgi:hypothetical protein
MQEFFNQAFAGHKGENLPPISIAEGYSNPFPAVIHLRIET